jgi:hypothetical protein
VLGIEVHLTSREILVRRAALHELGTPAWQHELFHTMAAPIPAASTHARRLWATLEEGLVAYLTRVAAVTRGAGAVDPRAWPDPEPADWEQLVMASYDPHPLAALLTQELVWAEPRMDMTLALDCLVATPEPPQHLPDTLRDSARRFVSRCPNGAAALLGLAVARWMPESLSPWPSIEMGNAAAPDPETR